MSWEPPVRLQLASDCVAGVDAKLAQVTRELDQWRALALSTAEILFVRRPGRS